MLAPAAALLLVTAVAATDPVYAIDPLPAEGLWVSTQLGAGVIDGDVVVGAGLGVGIETRPFALHLRAPLTLRALDLEPRVSPALPSACAAVRCEEWLKGGEISPEALTRIVDELRILHPGELFHLRAGPIFATLGHGQLVSLYTSAADWDRRKSGLYVESTLPWGRTQLQALAGSFLSPQELFAARVATSPLAGARALDSSLDRFLGRVRLGFEVAGDATAPRGSAIDAFGDILPGSATQPLVGLAADVSWPLLDDPSGDGGLQITPWLGGSSLVGLLPAAGAAPGIGAGAAAGLEGTVDLLLVALRGGGRILIDGPGHRSALFSTLYDVDRKRYARAAGGFSPTGVAELPAPGGIGGAGFVELLVLRAVRLGARVHVDPVPEASQAEVFAEVGAGPARVATRALRRAMRSADDIGLDEKTYVVTEAAWAVFPPFSLYGRWLHTPRFEDAPPPGFAPGDPVADDDVFVGVSFDLVLSGP
jgi:hypothetical protein